MYILDRGLHIHIILAVFVSFQEPATVVIYVNRSFSGSNSMAFILCRSI